MPRTTLLCIFTSMVLAVSMHAFAAQTAIVRVETIPATGTGAARFGGTPSGQVTLSANGTATLRADVAAGRHVSTLVSIDPALQSAGYILAAIGCDDLTSSRRSTGDVGASRATFEVEAGETVTCTFLLSIPSTAAPPPLPISCTCPKEGRWNVVNHPGSMACTGAVTMTMPLAPSRGQGTLKIQDGCDSILASGMSDGDADILMRLAPDCGYVGTVGGSQDGIPMTIEFRWKVESSKRITGDLGSTVARSGMTCRMSRTYELDAVQ